MPQPSDKQPVNPRVLSINDVMEMRKRTEAAIRDVVNTFMKATDLRVTDISVENVTYLDGRQECGPIRMNVEFPDF
jgi:hypothetical protein